MVLDIWHVSLSLFSLRRDKKVRDLVFLDDDMFAESPWYNACGHFSWFPPTLRGLSTFPALPICLLLPWLFFQPEAAQRVHADALPGSCVLAHQRHRTQHQRRPLTAVVAVERKG